MLDTLQASRADGNARHAAKHDNGATVVDSGVAAAGSDAVEVETGLRA